MIKEATLILRRQYIDLLIYRYSFLKPPLILIANTHINKSIQVQRPNIFGFFLLLMNHNQVMLDGLVTITNQSL